MRTNGHYYPYDGFFTARDRSSKAKEKHIAAVSNGLLDRTVPVIYNTNGEYEVVTHEEYKTYYGKDYLFQHGTKYYGKDEILP